MATADFTTLLQIASTSSIGNDSDPDNLDYADLPDDFYYAQVVKAEYRKTKTGRDMYVISLIVEKGDYSGHGIKWYKTLVEENGKALSWFFDDMTKLGMSRVEFATNPKPDDVVRKIILTGAHLKVRLKTQDDGFQKVIWAQRMVEHQTV